VNANIFTISPSGIGSGGYVDGDHCDGADNDLPWCLEVDWIESNGNCGGASTLHTVPGPGDNGCTAWGCRVNYHYNGRASFHMKIQHGDDGAWTVTRDGQRLSGWNPAMGGNDNSVMKSTLQSSGAVIYMSQWEGWVPVEDCGTQGDLAGSHFTISNLRVSAKVMQGPEPSKCSGSMRFYNSSHAII